MRAGPGAPAFIWGGPGTGAAASQADVSWREREPHREASARARAAGSPAGGPGRPSLVVAAASVSSADRRVRGRLPHLGAHLSTLAATLNVILSHFSLWTFGSTVPADCLARSAGISLN